MTAGTLALMKDVKKAKNINITRLPRQLIYPDTPFTPTPHLPRQPACPDNSFTPTPRLPRHPFLWLSTLDLIVRIMLNASPPPYVYWVCGCPPCGGNPRLFLKVKVASPKTSTTRLAMPVKLICDDDNISGTIIIVVVVITIIDHMKPNDNDTNETKWQRRKMKDKLRKPERNEPERNNEVKQNKKKQSKTGQKTKHCRAKQTNKPQWFRGTKFRSPGETTETAENHWKNNKFSN